MEYRFPRFSRTLTFEDLSDIDELLNVHGGSSAPRQHRLDFKSKEIPFFLRKEHGQLTIHGCWGRAEIKYFKTELRVIVDVPEVYGFKRPLDDLENFNTEPIAKRRKFM